MIFSVLSCKTNESREAFSTSLRPEIEAAWVAADSMSGDLLPLFAEVFSRIRRSEGRAYVMRYVGRCSRESEVAFRMGTVAVQDRAYALLAYSLPADALPVLTSLLKQADRRSVEDARVPQSTR
jgi:hypothetical protein